MQDLSPSAPARPSSGLPTFAAFQLLFWGLPIAGFYVPGRAQILGVPNAEVLRLLTASVLLGMVLSNGIAWVLVKVPAQISRGARMIPIVLGLCAITAGLWVAGMRGLEWITGTPPWIPPTSTPGHLTLELYLRSTVFLALWSAVFLVGLLSNRFQREREHRISASGLAHEAHVQLLRSQLNPHFLFNALNSIVALIDENPPAAQRMVRDVSVLLRKSLDNDGNAGGTVERELDFVRLYLKCEEVRFEERLKVTYAVDETAVQRALPSMLFHPLVENAIKHGMQADAGVLEVRIAVRAGADGLVLEVANTGTLRQKPEARGPGIGLRNVQARLRELFPDRHRFELVEANGWVTARITCLAPK